MKNIGILIVTLIVISCSTNKTINNNMTEDKSKITTVIKQFSLAGDNSKDELLATYLDDNYRVVMNRLFGSDKVSILSKEVYLAKIKSKEFGGTPRETKIIDILINGNAACVKVIFKGEKVTFNSLIILLKNKEGEWKLVSDIPTIA
jgi:hypothetical protein